MSSKTQKVREFNEAFNIEINNVPKIEKNWELTMRILREEVDELEEAYMNGDLIEVADAITDIDYIVNGIYIKNGIDPDICFNEVHESNMSKLDEDGKPIYREDGKVLKGDNYFKPDIHKCLNEQYTKRYIINNEEKAKEFAKNILDISCEYFGVTREQLFEKRRFGDLVRKRHIFLYVVYTTGIKPAYIDKALVEVGSGFDRSTKYHAIKTIRNEVTYNESIKSDVDSIRSKIRY